MDLGDYLSESRIAVGLDAGGKWDALEQMVDHLLRSGETAAGRDEILESLRRREETQSTGIGSGLAIPHARIAGYRGMTISIATFREPVPYDSLDGQPVSIAWMILVPEEDPTLALQAYSKIVALMQDEAVREYFVSTREPKQLYDYITKRKIAVGGVLTARDVMRPPLTHLRPETPLREVVHQMRRHHLEAVAIEDADRTLLGEITCDRLFQYGIPDFFNQLQSVGFISRFDPFERYFAQEAKAVARDVMLDDFAAVPPDATILEVVFALTVKRHMQVYVVENGRRIGTIDRTEVLDRILDF